MSITLIAKTTAIIKPNLLVPKHSPMITVVVIINISIALFNFYLAWRIWKIRRRIAQAAKVIAKAERSTYNVLHAAPNVISRGQKGTSALRDRYSQLAVQIQRLQQILGLLYLGKKFWYDRTQKPSQSKLNKRRSRINLKIQNRSTLT